MSSKEYSGFASLFALHVWFDGWHKVLSALGYVIAVYEVPLCRIRYAVSQLVFRRGDLLPVRTLPLVKRD